MQTGHSIPIASWASFLFWKKTMFAAHFPRFWLKIHFFLQQGNFFGRLKVQNLKIFTFICNNCTLKRKRLLVTVWSRLLPGCAPCMLWCDDVVVLLLLSTVLLCTAQKIREKGNWSSEMNPFSEGGLGLLWDIWRVFWNGLNSCKTEQILKAHDESMLCWCTRVL